MNQEKIGKFIAEVRKKKNLTQQELADKLGLTYKAVSKWECGKGLPDVSLYKEICKILDISLNEFFAGEYLSNDKMIQKSEENIMNIVNEENAKKRKEIRHEETFYYSADSRHDYDRVCLGLCRG